MTVRYFIMKHLSGPLCMTTPGGFIEMSLKEAKDMVENGYVIEYPNNSEFGIKMNAEDLLSEVIVAAKFNHGTWNLTTKYPPDETQDISYDRNAILAQLRIKLDKNMADMQGGWLAMTPRDVMERAQKIVAARTVYDELYSGWAYQNDMLEHLLRFENPLEVVSDKWITEQCMPDISEEMRNALFSVMEDASLENTYKLDENYTGLGNQGINMTM